MSKNRLIWKYLGYIIKKNDLSKIQWGLGTKNMNITFLIGNGFDRNLGLNTTYADFIKYYKTTEGGSKILETFRQHINDNEELWRDAEVALGKYTEDFETGNGMAFSECHQDLCEHLVEYLKKEESRLAFDNTTENILAAFQNITTPEVPFPTQEKNTIREVFNRYKHENYNFDFICFNYTSTLDKCLEIVKNSTGALGQHRHGNNVYSHTIRQLCHVHGTLEKEIVFAVNDENQIAKPDIFDFEDGEICKHLLIKQQANESYQENTDTKARQLLQNSTIIYIYGMSLGETDALWWNRICNWLRADNSRHLIIQNFSMSKKGVYQLPYLLAEKRKKKEILAFSDFDDETKTLLMKRIHITGDNIFSGIKDIAIADVFESATEESLAEVITTEQAM